MTTILNGKFNDRIFKCKNHDLSFDGVSEPLAPLCEIISFGRCNDHSKLICHYFQYSIFDKMFAFGHYMHSMRCNLIFTEFT